MMPTTTAAICDAVMGPSELTVVNRLVKRDSEDSTGGCRGVVCCTDMVAGVLGVEVTVDVTAT